MGLANNPEGILITLPPTRRPPPSTAPSETTSPKSADRLYLRSQALPGSLVALATSTKLAGAPLSRVPCTTAVLPFGLVSGDLRLDKEEVSLIMFYLSI